MTRVGWMGTACLKTVVVPVVLAVGFLCQIFHMSSITRREPLATTHPPGVHGQVLHHHTALIKDTTQPRELSAKFRVADVNDNEQIPLPKIQQDLAKQLALGGYRNINKGSGDIPQAGPLLMMISKLQIQNLGLLGSVGELGVHHGRFTSFLFVTARREEDLVVADLFQDLQEFNVDHSGHGNKQKFLKGLQTYGLSETDLHTVHTGSTMELPFDWAEQAGFAPFRIVSVDAGHTAALAFNDLQVAFCNLLPSGIVILDDFFHSAWPGVSEAFFRLLWQAPETLSNVPIFPFLACKSKLFLTNDRAAYELYYAELSKATELVRPYANEKSMKYELNGVQYLHCKTEEAQDAVIQRLWATSTRGLQGAESETLSCPFLERRDTNTFT
eukprot:scaffold4162_cov162-Amphora_coffeaeformis.AAC.8